MDKLRYLSLAVIAFFLINLTVGIFRRPIDIPYLVEAEKSFHPFDSTWGREDPGKSHNFIIGTFGSIWQRRDNHEIYEIRVVRYFNVLPDVIMKPRLVGHYWEVPNPSKMK